MKKRIFIGSSWEARELAQQIQAKLKDRFECVLWYEGFFTLGDHYFTDLIRKIITFDYAIMIGAEDDRVTRITTNDQKTSPRDNVYLEYGLFSGILSPKRVLLLIHKNCLAASDLSGMSLAQYADGEHAVCLAEQWLNALTENGRSRSIGRKDIELLPTVGIAVGYFHNFVKPFITRLLEQLGSPCFKLNVCIPDFVCDDVNFYQQDLILRKGLKKDLVCNFRILVDPTVDTTISAYDVPSTILALFKTVNFIFENQEGNTEDTLCAKARALDNFHDNLCTLIANDPYAKRLVTVTRFSEQLL